jgi:hypothetical protein
MRSSTRYYYNDQIRGDDMGRVFSAHGEVRNAYKVWLESSRGRYHSEVLGVDGRIILKRILRKYDGECGLDSAGSG